MANTFTDAIRNANPIIFYASATGIVLYRVIVAVVNQGNWSDAIFWSLGAYLGAVLLHGVVTLVRYNTNPSPIGRHTRGTSVVVDGSSSRAGDIHLNVNGTEIALGSVEAGQTRTYRTVHKTKNGKSTTSVTVTSSNKSK